jgi:FKBP-type peptidyl-prolyl cis-trans isomerase FkpA
MKLVFRSMISYFVVLTFGCAEVPKEDNKISDQQIQESLIKANQKISKNELSDIEAYILKNGLKMEKSGTGLRYTITGNGTGSYALPGMKATVKYKVSLLNGRVCYSSDLTGNEQFVVDNDEVESGLHEGVKRMKVGNKAKFILPSHLAHGLIGKEDKIPAHAPIVYDIELLELNK